jgi:hypothetical protein
MKVKRGLDRWLKKIRKTILSKRTKKASIPLSLILNSPTNLEVLTQIKFIRIKPKRKKHQKTTGTIRGSKGDKGRQEACLFALIEIRSNEYTNSAIPTKKENGAID